MALKIEMLRCFCAVARAGNLADAADVLGRTQSAVSMTLKQLEAHLGAPLFAGERKGRLTTLGDQVYALAQKQLHGFDATVQAIETSARAPQGILRVAAVPSVAALVYPALVQRMTARFPGLRIELRDSDTAQVIEALGQGWADIGIASARHTQGGVRAAPLLSDRFGLVCGAGHPLAQGSAPASLSAMRDHPFLRNALCDHIQTPAFRAFLEGAGVTVHNTQSLLAMVRGGDWVTVLPRSVMGLAPDDLRFRVIEQLPDRRQVMLYLREQVGVQGIAQEAHDFIAALGWQQG